MKDVHQYVSSQHSNQAVAPLHYWGSSWHLEYLGAWTAVSSLNVSSLCPPIWAKVSDRTSSYSHCHDSLTLFNI